jgi:diguanylate cyclase (GGDEF)-like protein
MSSLGRIVRLSLLPLIITTAVILTVGMFYSEQNREHLREALRSEVDSALGVVSARMQTNIRTITSEVAGIVNVIELDPELMPARFQALAALTIAKNPGILRISLAPDGVVSDVVPAREKPRLVGMRFDRFVSQRNASHSARARKQPVIGGHMVLPDGMSGFTTYLPIAPRDKNGRQTFWGYLELVIADSAIYKDILHQVDGASPQGKVLRWNNLDVPIAVSIRDISIQNSNSWAFLGTNLNFKQDPILRTVRIAGGTWELAGINLDGWDQRPKNETIVTLLMLGAALVAVAAIVFTAWIVNARQLVVRALDQRNNEFLTMSQRLNLALESSRFAIWEIDLETNVRTWDERMYQLHGLTWDPQSPTAGHPDSEAWTWHMHLDDRAKAERAWEATIRCHAEYKDDYRIVVKGHIRHVRHVGAFHQASDGRRKVTGISWDITEDVEMTAALRAAKALAEANADDLAAAKDRIEHNALHDPLTGLGNRRMLDAVLGEVLGDEAGSGSHIALLHLDLDRFKQINDTLGHAAGDAMLVHAAQILRDHSGPHDIVARIGGDEFVIVVSNPVEADLSALSKSIIAAMRQPVTHEGSICRFGVSVGIALSDGTTDAQRLLVNADIALYRAKEKGRNRFEFFTEALQSEIIENKRIADEILEGIERDEFIAWYQPQFDAETLELAGLEALIRWNHPRDGILTPDAFLSIAEDHNVMAALDRIVMDRALIDMMRWAADGIHVPRVSVNVSAKRLRDPTLPESLTGLSFSPGQLCFELVEAIFLDDNEEVLTQNIAAIRALGIEIEIDDFGTGHTSIVSLLKIRPKRLKIDRQLVSPMTSSVREQTLVRAIIEIGHSLGIETVAEGVETQAHAEMLAVLGCDLLQGYAFSKPLSARDFATFAASGLQFGDGADNKMRLIS